MPRKDPHTGCIVMTTMEFFDSEAKQEGKGRTGAQVMEEVFYELDADEQHWADEIRAQAPATLPEWQAKVLQYYPPEDAEKEPRIERVLEVEAVKARLAFRESGFEVTARVLCQDGQERRLTYKEWTSPGSREEPPDGGEEYEWLENTLSSGS